MKCSPGSDIESQYLFNNVWPGLEVIKLEFMIRLKITRVRKQPIIVLYFESETVLKFYNLEARSWSN